MYVYRSTMYIYYCFVSPLHLTTNPDRVKCCQGEWVPWVHGTIVTLWYPGDSAYGILCDNGRLIQAPEDDDFCIQKLSSTAKMDEADRLHDEALFKNPPVEDDCPICMQRLPMVDATMMKTCCGQNICAGCIHANQRSHTCPFCREAGHVTAEEQINRLKKRMEMGDAKSYHALANMYDEGRLGLKHDPGKAYELWSKSSELGYREAHYKLHMVYSGKSADKVVEKDMKKEMYHLEMAAIKGHGRARCELGHHESHMGNWDRAKKHWILSAGMGCECCMSVLKEGYMKGAVSEDEYSGTLHSHRESIDEVSSAERTAAQSVAGVHGDVPLPRLNRKPRSDCEKKGTNCSKALQSP